MALEIEAKILSVDIAACREKLAACGYVCTRPRFKMRRYTFMLTEMPGLIDNGNKWARVRDEGDKVTMTFKHTFNASAEGTNEIEFIVSDFDKAAEFMRGLGYHNAAYQENFRENWVKGEVEVSFSEWPGIPAFAEVEGPTEDQVKKACTELNFDFTQAVFGGVGAVYGIQSEVSAADISKVKVLTFENARRLKELVQHSA